MNKKSLLFSSLFTVIATASCGKSDYEEGYNRFSTYHEEIREMLVLQNLTYRDSEANFTDNPKNEIDQYYSKFIDIKSDFSDAINAINPIKENKNEICNEFSEGSKKYVAGSSHSSELSDRQFPFYGTEDSILSSLEKGCLGEVGGIQSLYNSHIREPLDWSVPTAENDVTQHLEFTESGFKILNYGLNSLQEAKSNEFATNTFSILEYNQSNKELLQVKIQDTYEYDELITSSVDYYGTPLNKFYKYRNIEVSLFEKDGVITKLNVEYFDDELYDFSLIEKSSMYNSDSSQALYFIFESGSILDKTIQYTYGHGDKTVFVKEHNDSVVKSFEYEANVNKSIFETSYNLFRNKIDKYHYNIVSDYTVTTPVLPFEDGSVYILDSVLNDSIKPSEINSTVASSFKDAVINIINRELSISL